LASKSQLLLVCIVRGHKARIVVHAGLYHKADARDINGKLRPANSGCRDAICIQVREHLEIKGIKLLHVSWEELHIEVVAHLDEDESIDDFEQDLTPHDVYRLQVARNLRKALDKHEADQKAEQLSLFEDHPAQLSADDICGCVPFPVTKK
jgi:hypothetical protein